MEKVSKLKLVCYTGILGMWLSFMIFGYSWIWEAVFHKSQLDDFTSEWQWKSFLMGYGLAVVAVWYAGTGGLDWTVKIFGDYRDLNILEKERLEMYAQNVITNINKTRGTDFKLADFNLYVEETPDVNAFAFGANNICFTVGLLEESPQDVAEAVLAHEFGHLINADTRTSLLRWIAYLPYTIWGFAISARENRMANMTAWEMSERARDMLNERPPKVIGKRWIAVMVLIAPAVFGMMFAILFMMFGADRNSQDLERRADLFSCEVGYTDALFRFCEVLAKMNYQDHNLLSKFFNSHPSARVRMGYIEEYRRGLITE